MKKIYFLFAAVLIGTVAMAQTNTVAKSSKKSKKKAAVASEIVKSSNTEVKDVVAAPDAIQNHSGAPTTTPAVNIAKPVGEDNLLLKETNHDFGKIAQGKPVYYDFSFKNTGKTELKLDDVRAGCGCTTPTWKPGPYKPGETASINVGFNAGSVGPFTKSVTITYNSGLTKVITFNGEVLAAPVTPAPENKSVGVLKGN